MSKQKQQILDQLKYEITHLQLTPGTKLSESILTERFSLSRTPIRDILKHLSSEGYLDIYPQRGTVISYIDLSSVEQVIYMRFTFEKEIAHDLCHKLSLEAEHRLRDTLGLQKQLIEENSSIESFIDADDMFHYILYEVAGRKFLWEVLKQFNVHYSRYRRLHMLGADKQIQLMKDHETLLTLISNPDSVSYDVLDALLRKHLRSDITSDYFKSHFSEYIK